MAERMTARKRQALEMRSRLQSARFGKGADIINNVSANFR